MEVRKKALKGEVFLGAIDEDKSTEKGGANDDGFSGL